MTNLQERSEKVFLRFRQSAWGFVLFRWVCCAMRFLPLVEMTAEVVVHDRGRDGRNDSPTSRSYRHSPLCHPERSPSCHPERFPFVIPNECEGSPSTKMQTNTPLLVMESVMTNLQERSEKVFLRFRQSAWGFELFRRVCCAMRFLPLVEMTAGVVEMTEGVQSKKQSGNVEIADG